jgi:hypothetical protein
MNLKQILELLSKYDPESDVAFQVDGAGANGTHGTSFRLLEIWERPFFNSENKTETLIFMNITAE